MHKLRFRLAMMAIPALIAVSFAGSLEARPAGSQSPDPGADGPFAVTREVYDFGDKAFTTPDSIFPAELRASVHYPTDLSGGPFPLVVIVHGAHTTCYKKKQAAFGWPCKGKFQPIPSYAGYDYISAGLASHGFFVVSLSFDGIWAANGGLPGSELIQKHLDLWKTFNTSGGEPFGQKFVGKVDMQRIGVMGHSAGGLQVTQYYSFNLKQPSPYSIKAVFALAPVASSEPLNGVPLGIMLAYCDGDVGLAGVRYYDSSRYNQAGDPAAKHTILVMGANHDFFNTIWTPGQFRAGAHDDAEPFASDAECGPGSPHRLSDALQRAVARAYVMAFFRVYIGGESQFLPMLTGAAPQPQSSAGANVLVTYLPPDDPRFRLDVNRMLSSENLITNTAGGAVSTSGLTEFDLCGGSAGTCLFAGSALQEPDTSSQTRLRWTVGGATYQNELAVEARDVSRFEALQFRAAVNFSDAANNLGESQDFTVELADGAGLVAAVRASSVSNALFYPPGHTPSSSDQRGVLPRLILNAVRIPLSEFNGISLQDVRSIRFKFDQKPKGALLVTDIAFVTTPAQSP